MFSALSSQSRKRPGRQRPGRDIIEELPVEMLDNIAKFLTPDFKSEIPVSNLELEPEWRDNCKSLRLVSRTFANLEILTAAVFHDMYIYPHPEVLARLMIAKDCDVVQQYTKRIVFMLPQFDQNLRHRDDFDTRVREAMSSACWHETQGMLKDEHLSNPIDARARLVENIVTANLKNLYPKSTRQAAFERYLFHARLQKQLLDSQYIETCVYIIKRLPHAREVVLSGSTGLFPVDFVEQKGIIHKKVTFPAKLCGSQQVGYIAGPLTFIETDEEMSFQKQIFEIIKQSDLHATSLREVAYAWFAWDLPLMDSQRYKSMFSYLKRLDLCIGDDYDKDDEPSLRVVHSPAIKLLAAARQTLASISIKIERYAFGDVPAIRVGEMFAWEFPHLRYLDYNNLDDDRQDDMLAHFVRKHHKLETLKLSITYKYAGLRNLLQALQNIVEFGVYTLKLPAPVQWPRCPIATRLW